ncbi:ribonuclease R [Ekhidna sp.]|uniref:ribonuclease R n=1 Tax=Ekhidna sp. TaxID=2608089 RepID=UPI00329996B2
MSKKQKKKLGSRSKQQPNHVKQIKSKLHEVFSLNDGKSYGYRDLIRKLQLRDKKSKDYLKTQLFSLESKDKIRRLSDGRFVSNVESEYIQGTIDHVNPNFAYVVTPEPDEDIWVKTSDLNFAIHGDLVSVVMTKPSGKGYRPEGKVVNILKRSRDEFVGRIEISEKFSFVIPDSRNIHFDIMVYPEKIGKATPNDKVMVKIDKWHDAKNRSPLGIVTEVLGQAGENEAEIHSIMAEFGLPFRFPKKIEKAADEISDLITDEEIKKRRDFRDITTFTIDPHDAKDFDDALSIKELDKGNYEIGIHIADVSHYVDEGSELDKEAIDRATSVYLVDRTIPMLPERLSNGLCSLRPKEEKLTFSAVFEMDSKGAISKKWFGRTVINSDRRFTYEEAQERIEGLDSDFTKEIVTLNNIAKQLRKKRFQHGAVNFETVEVKFRLADDGKPLEVIPKERKDAHKMIEEFMLLANKEVATHIFKWKEKGKEEGSKTFVYRVHDDPDPEKLNTFASFAAKFGHKIDLGKNLSGGLNKLMDDINGKPEQNVLESLAIRSMAKAKYTTDPRGHFGLAFDHYTHFTSPIRRYPDVMVHRLLEHYLQGGKNMGNEEHEPLCMHSSEREKRAADAERASIKYKQVEFMETMLGQEFEGIVSGVTEWGIFVEIIKTKCEGMIRMADLDDDFYEFDEKQMRVVGRNNKRIITLGEKLKVLVAKTDIDRRTIDLELVKDETE